jgi:catechol 2,3-dioxygenase-like lactoylglutathione lyase family enzyme
MEAQTKTEANVEQAVPFFRVTSMEASLRFYVDGLGFEMTKKWTPDGDGKIRWCWLQHGKAALMLQEYRREGPNSWTAGWQTRRRRFHLLPMQRHAGHL